MYTDQQLLELIDCHKKIIEPPKFVRSERTAFTKKVFSLCSCDEMHDFSGFITQNIKFEESFSIGLVYKPKLEKNSIVLLRCNGIHGAPNSIIPHHSYCHVHYCSAERINDGLKAEGVIVKAEDYSTINDAIIYYVKRINLIPDHRAKYFPQPKLPQVDLFGNLI
jgi:hypothetical protein